MASHQAPTNTPKVGWPGSRPKDLGKQPQVGKKDRLQFSSKSAPIEVIQRQQDRSVSKDSNTILKHPLPSPTGNTPGKEISQAEDRKRKRKRSQDEENPSSTTTPSQKRTRASPRTIIERTTSENTAVGVGAKKIDPLEYWTKELCWPKEFFEPDSNMNHLLARQKSSSSLREKQSEASSATPSDQKPREGKSTSYTRPSYETVLATRGSFMGKFELDITDESKRLCRTLLSTEQSVPLDSLFRDDLFEETCESVRGRNEAMVVRDISPLICPPAQVFRIYGAKHLKSLNESVNEGWNSAIPFYGPRPQPDYSVGFGRSAFTNDQLEKFKPFVGEITDTCTSYFMATWQMYLPFLTCEVKCGAAALDVADRQNAHSMTLAVRGIVELFRLVKREKELDREILAFSISHDHRNVRIYGHYPIINGKKTTFYRHPVHEFSFTALEGKEKWTAYKFTKNVYDIWMPSHLERICSAIDKLPSDLDFEVSEQSEPRESESHHLYGQSSHDGASLLEEADGSQSSCVGSHNVTSDTSLSERVGMGAFKKPRKRGRSVALHQEPEID